MLNCRHKGSPGTTALLSGLTVLQSWRTKTRVSSPLSLTKTAVCTWLPALFIWYTLGPRKVQHAVPRWRRYLWMCITSSRKAHFDSPTRKSSRSCMMWSRGRCWSMGAPDGSALQGASSACWRAGIHSSTCFMKSWRQRRQRKRRRVGKRRETKLEAKVRTPCQWMRIMPSECPPRSWKLSLTSSDRQQTSSALCSSVIRWRCMMGFLSNCRLKSLWSKNFMALSPSCCRASSRGSWPQPLSLGKSSLRFHFRKGTSRRRTKICWLGMKQGRW